MAVPEPVGSRWRVDLSHPGQGRQALTSGSERKAAVRDRDLFPAERLAAQVIHVVDALVDVRFFTVELRAAVDPTAGALLELRLACVAVSRRDQAALDAPIAERF